MKICFLSLNAYPLLANINAGYVGGAELEQVCLGRELVAHGYDVCFVTYRQGIDPIEKAVGIEIIQAYEREKARKLSVLSKYACLLSSLRKAGADIYFHQAGSYGVLPIFCHMNRKRFVYRIASDAIVLSKSLFGRYTFIERLADVLEIKKAHIVIAQSEFQKRMLRDRFNVQSVVIKNGLSLPKINYRKKNLPIVLWVGSITNAKSPWLLVELAECLPDAQFEMIGGKTEKESQLYDEIAMAARNLPNLAFHGFVPYNCINEYFEKASIFVNTSSIEGFPNTFIQAWANNIPVVTLNVDPDRILQNKQLGMHSGTFNQLVTNVTALLHDEKLREKMGRNARRHVEEEHDIKKTVDNYIQIFRKIA